ncbi:MAG: hypothetical protein AAF560_10605 [Acidobacteriota bacterium]
MVAACRKIGDLETADSIAAEGSMIRTSSVVANAEYLLQTGVLRLVQNRGSDALLLVNRAWQFTARELEKIKPTAKESQHRRRWIQATHAAAHVIRGEIFHDLGIGSAPAAFADALTALQQTSKLVKASAHTRRVNLSALTLLCALLVRFGEAEEVQNFLPVLDDAEQTLIYRCRLPPSHIHRIKMKWSRALVLARLGAFDKAESLMIEVVQRLQAGGYEDDANRAIDALIWVVQQTSMPARAGYFELKYRR